MTASKHTAMPPDGRAFVSSFARGLKVIESFGPDNRSMTVAEVAERTGVDRAVARRLLLTLVHLGFVHVHERRFELTTHVLRLAYSFLSSAGLGASLQPFLDDLARNIRETVSISVLDDAEVVFVARSDIRAAGWPMSSRQACGCRPSVPRPAACCWRIARSPT